METPLATAIPVQLPHSAARPHTGGKRRGRHTSVTTGGDNRERERDVDLKNEENEAEISTALNPNPKLRNHQVRNKSQAACEAAAEVQLLN